MALEHIQYALDYHGELSTVAAFALLVIAHRIGTHDSAWPSYEDIGQQIRKSARTALAACRELEAKGILHIESGKKRGGCNRFRILIPEKYHADFARKHAGHPDYLDRYWKENRRYAHAPVDNPPLVNNLGSTLPTPQRSPQPTHVGSTLPTEVGKKDANLGNPPPDGTKSASDEQDIKNQTHEQLMFIPPAPAEPPPENQYLPPVDSTQFKDRVFQICYELGAPPSVAAGIYERNNLLKWSVLRTVTLKCALSRAIDHWRKKNPAAYQSERLRRYLAAHPELKS